MSVYGYIRINSRRPRSQKFSLLQQSRMIRSFAESQGWPFKQTLRDIVISDRSDHWPRLNHLKQLIISGKVSVLIVPRLDRLGRDIRKVAGLLDLLAEHKVRLVALADDLDSNTKSGRAVLQALGHVGRWENRRIPDRTREFIERKRDQGERVGHAPFGFHYVRGILVAHEREQRLAHIIREQRGEGLSYHRIAKFLNTKRYPSKRGGKWYAETVKSVCTGPTSKPAPSVKPV